MTNEQLYEILGNISGKHIREAKIMIKKTEEETMSKNRIKIFQRPAVAVAAFALCVLLSGMAAVASSEKTEGFFKDIVRFDGAVTGTIYKEATDEIEITVADVSDEMIVEVNMVNPEMVPYRELDLLGFNKYEIADRSGNIIAKGDATEMMKVVNGTVNVSIPLDHVAKGEYKLMISEMVGSSKADQPLVIYGTWEGEFVVE